jgi:hypothetical protein
VKVVLNILYFKSLNNIFVLKRKNKKIRKEYYGTIELFFHGQIRFPIVHAFSYEIQKENRNKLEKSLSQSPGHHLRVWG